MMHALYALLAGPGLWISFIIFFVGFLFRLARLYGLSRERDRVFYNHIDFKWGLRSIVHWLVPWGSASMRSQPLFTFVFFVFHICLLAVPIFLLAHNTLWHEAFGVSAWSMPDKWADMLTLVFMASAVFLFLRRLIRSEVRILTTPWDYTLLVLTLLPFLTGFLAYHQTGGPYQVLLVLHIFFAELLLIIVPFTKLGHAVLFFFSRAFIGFEMGSRRGARSW